MPKPDQAMQQQVLEVVMVSNVSGGGGRRQIVSGTPVSSTTLCVRYWYSPHPYTILLSFQSIIELLLPDWIGAFSPVWNNMLFALHMSYK